MRAQFLPLLFRLADMKYILIVDDTRPLAESIADILQMEGYEVDIAANGIHALNTMASRVPDMVITDLLMPEMDGLSLIRKIRSSDRYSSIPVIVLTADASEESSQMGKEAGADLLLTKPFDDTYLIEWIQKMLTDEQDRTH